MCLPGTGGGLRRRRRRGRLFRLPVLQGPFRRGTRLCGRRRRRTGHRRHPQGCRRLCDRPEAQGSGRRRERRRVCLRAAVESRRQEDPGRRLHPAEANVGRERGRTDAQQQEPQQPDHRRGLSQHGCLQADRHAARSRRGHHREDREEGLQETRPARLGAGTPEPEGPAGRVPLPLQLRGHEGAEARDGPEGDGLPGQRHIRGARPRQEGEEPGTRQPLAAAHRGEPGAGRGHEPRRLPQDGRGRLQPPQAREPRDLRLARVRLHVQLREEPEQDRPEHRRAAEVQQPLQHVLHQGPAPGPIDNPGADALKGALAPTHDGWYYFISLDGKTSKFTKTLAEHNKLVDEFNASRKKG